MIDNATLSLVTEIIARNVAVGAEVARTLGYKMPKDYDVGLRVIYDHNLQSATGERVRFRIRMADASYDSVVLVPHMDGRIPLRLVDKMWKEAMARISDDARMLAHVWVVKHPEAVASGVDLRAALAKLNALEADDKAMREFMTACEERAKRFDYKRVR